MHELSGAHARKQCDFRGLMHVMFKDFRGLMHVDVIFVILAAC